MTDAIDFLTEIKKEDFPYLYTSPQLVQDVLNQFEKHIQISMQQHYYINVNCRQDREIYLRESKEIDRLNKYMNKYEERFLTEKDKTNKMLYLNEFNNYYTQFNKSERRLGDRTPANYTNDLLKAKYTKMIANGIENLGNAIGEWFETGAVGPGTVTFNGRTFTAQ